MPFIRSFLIHLLTFESRLALAVHRPRVIAVVGSVGKTTTKDAIYAALAGEVYVRKNAKSFNSEIGVPLTILGLDNPWSDPWKWVEVLARGLFVALFARRYPAWLIAEVGADRPGDIRRIARWLRPEIVVYTGVPEVPVHVEYFASPEEVFAEKRSIVEYLRPGGVLIANADDPHAEELRTDYSGAFVSYGCERGEVRASHEEIIMQNDLPAGVRFRANAGGSSVPLSLQGALGRPRIYAALAALSVARQLGVDMVAASRGLSYAPVSPGRMRLIEGAARSVLIDDTYNSSPAALHAALDTLENISAQGRKIAILGDMLELGTFSAREHAAAGEHAARAAGMLITVGFRARGMAEAALDAGMPGESVRSYEADEAARASSELRLEVRPGDVILVKGSQSMRMERAVKALMAHPEKASSLLVRQEQQWQER